MKYVFTTIALLIAMSMQAQVQDSLNMSLLYRYDPDTIPTSGSREFNECFGYVTPAGEEIAVLGSSGRVHFFDVTDPVNTYEINWFTGGSVTTWRDMKTYKDHVYSVCDSCDEGLMVFDMADAPSSVTLSNQTTEFFGRSHNIFIDECPGRLYAVGTDSLSGGLVVLDIATDPDNPILLKNMILAGGYVHDMYIKDNMAFCNHGNNGMYAYDFTDLDNPILLGTLTDYAESGYNHSSWVNEDGNTLVLCDETFNKGVKTVNIEDASDMYVEQVFRSTLLAPDDTASIAHNPLIRGNIAFLSYYHDGVAVYDISDPANVQKVAYFDTEPNNTTYGGFTGCWGVYPFLPSGNILASDMTRGLHVLSLENVDLIPINITIAPSVEIEVIGSTNLCFGDSVILQVAAGEDAYSWSNGIDTVGAENFLVVYESGTYSVCAANCLYSICSTVDIEVIAFEPETFDISNDDKVLISEAGQSYQWYFENEAITDATNQDFEATENGNYYVVIINDDGCEEISETLNVVISSIGQIDILNQFSVYPNPMSDALFISMESSERANFTFSLQTIDGKTLTVLEKEIVGATLFEMNLTDYASGVYLLKVKSGDGVLVKKITKK
jgi:choice-of-anchor B domain-containing protein